MQKELVKMVYKANRDAYNTQNTAYWDVMVSDDSLYMCLRLSCTRIFVVYVYDAVTYMH